MDYLPCCVGAFRIQHCLPALHPACHPPPASHNLQGPSSVTTTPALPRGSLGNSLLGLSVGGVSKSRI